MATRTDSDLVVIGDGALLAALTRARGHTMRDIVATIQAEQDEAIRAPWQGFTMISGGPGTGKTVVALHRAAYLLYSNRRRFESGGVLVVGPSRIFLNYIERVLPSLGEESVTLRSIGAVASDVVPINGDRIDPPDVAAIKGSLRMVPILRRLVQEPPQSVPLELRVSWHGHVLVLTSAVLARLRADVLAHHRYNHGREAAASPARRLVAHPTGGGGDGSRGVRRAGQRHRPVPDVLQRVVAGGQCRRGPSSASRSGAAAAALGLDPVSG